MYEVDILAIRNFISEIGLKQKFISEKSGISETALCLILQGKRKCEAGEYASLCNALGVSSNKFIKLRFPDEKLIKEGG